MITFPATIADKLATPRGTQPILVLEVDWKEGSTIAYSDATYSGAAPRLISIGTVDETEGVQVSNQISVVLDSTDDIVETIFRTTDVHLRPVRLYLGYSDTTEKALLFSGLINSAVTWDEAGRSLQFDVLNKLEDSLVAFTMEDGNFPIVSEDDRGKVWPLPFGTVCKYDSQRLTTTIKGFLLEGLGAVDPTLATRICQIEKTQCPTITVPVLKAANNPYGSGSGAVTSEERPDPNCLARKANEGCMLKDLLAKQQALSPSSFQVKNGENFPQNQNIKIRVGTVSYRGVMSGTTFTVSAVYHPDVDKIAECKNVRDPALGWRNIIGDEDDANSCANYGSQYNLGFNVPGEDCIVAESYGIGGNFYSSCGFNPKGSTYDQVVTGGSADSWEYYDSMPTGSFIWNAPGTEVILQEYDDDLVYMVSLVPGTVTQVLAYRQFGDQKLLSQVPTEWYTVEEIDYGGYTCVELRFNTLPSSSDQPGWEDDIIVSFVSSVGPNPVDIIEWLVDTYTDFTVDSANFAAVKALLTEFESNFVVQERKSVLQLINEIAYQQRMGVRISNGVVSLVYFGAEPTSLRTLTSADLIQGSFKITYTETENLRTNHQITWKEEYNHNIQGEEVEKDLQIRFNIPKYGTSTEEKDWYTQNTFATVLKTSTFWLIRESMTWQHVEFTTTIEHLDLEIFDSVTLDIAQFPTTKIVITEKRYNSDDNTITWRAWTPIRAGEDEEYLWAWPAAVTNGIWPLPTEADQTQIGDGSGLQVIPPVGHPLRVGYVEGETPLVSAGDSFPSDVGFTAPEVVCSTPLGNEVVFAQTPIIDPLAKQNFQQDMQNKQNGNGGGISIDYPNEDAPCTFSGLNPCPPENREIGDEDEEQGCTYLVRLTYIVPNLVRRDGCTGPCLPDTPTPGHACNGSIVVVETQVNNYESATAAVLYHEQQAALLLANCQFRIGVIAPYAGHEVITRAEDGSLWYNTEPPAGKCPASDGDLPIGQKYAGTTISGDPGGNAIPPPFG